MLKNSSCSSAARWSTGNLDVIPIEPLNALPAKSACAPQVSVQSQNLLDAPQQTLSAPSDSVSYSVAHGMTLASRDVAHLSCCSAVSGREIRKLKGQNERKQAVLASDEESATLDALRFSLASDIVELVVLTFDEVFLQTLRDTVGGARRLWHVASPDKVSDLLVAGEVGILVLDAQALNEAPAEFVGQIKRQFPDLVVMVAGNRHAEISLAGLISAGTVYRFIHKPMSPGRARLFADAAVKKYEEQRRQAAAVPVVKNQS